MKHFPPATIAVIGLVLGTASAVAGIFVLSGLGWALLAGAVAPLMLATIIFRGLNRG